MAFNTPTVCSDSVSSPRRPAPPALSSVVMVTRSSSASRDSACSASARPTLTPRAAASTGASREPVASGPATSGTSGSSSRPPLRSSSCTPAARSPASTLRSSGAAQITSPQPARRSGVAASTGISSSSQSTKSPSESSDAKTRSSLTRTRRCCSSDRISSPTAPVAPTRPRITTPPGRAGPSRGSRARSRRRGPGLPCGGRRRPRA